MPKKRKTTVYSVNNRINNTIYCGFLDLVEMAGLNPRLTCFIHAFYILSLSLTLAARERQTDLRLRPWTAEYSARVTVKTRTAVPCLKMMPAACRQETSGEHTLIKQRKRDDYCLRLNLKVSF